MCLKREKSLCCLSWLSIQHDSSCFIYFTGFHKEACQPFWVFPHPALFVWPEVPAQHADTGLTEGKIKTKNIHFAISCVAAYLKREAPPSAITLSTLAAWQWRILKRIRIKGGGGENGAVGRKRSAIKMGFESGGNIHPLDDITYSVPRQKI